MNIKNELNQEVPKELISWSKWLVAINLSGATGCVVVLNGLPPEKLASVGQNLILAILFFVGTVFTAIVFNLLLATEVRQSFQLRKVHILLALLQLVLFISALIFLCLWVFGKIN